jgi:hypothetical protein
VASAWRQSPTPFRAKVKNEWSYTSTPPYALMACTMTTTPRSSKWSLHFMFSNQNPVYISLLPTCATCPTQPYNIDEEYKSWSRSLFSYIQPPVTYSCLGSNIFPKTLLQGDINKQIFVKCMLQFRKMWFYPVKWRNVASLVCSFLSKSVVTKLYNDVSGDNFLPDYVKPNLLLMAKSYQESENRYQLLVS